MLLLAELSYKIQVYILHFLLHLIFDRNYFIIKQLVDLVLHMRRYMGGKVILLCVLLIGARR